MAEAEILSAPRVIEYPFSRTVGPVQSAFLTGLREGLVLGVRTGDGRVLCPPVEYDPVTSEELGELVELGDEGTVTTWSWEPSPRPNQPLDRPFAWALVRLDGADTGLLHALDAGSPDRVSTGMRVRVRWGDPREGAITHIACLPPPCARSRCPRPCRIASLSARSARRPGSTTRSPRARPRPGSSGASSPTGSWASAAAPAARSSCRPGARAPSTACPPASRSSCPTGASSPPSAWSTSSSPARPWSCPTYAPPCCPTGAT